MSVELWKLIFDWATVVLIALTVVSGSGALITGNVINKRQQAKLQQFDGDLTAAKTELKKQEERAAKAEGAIGEVQRDIADANARAAKAELETAKLYALSAPRRLTGKQKDELAKSLAVTKAGLAIVSPITDGEASDFADDFDSAVRGGAHWNTLRIKNRITEKFGLSVVTTEGTMLPTVTLLDDALTAIHVPHDVTTFKVGDASTSPNFEAGFLYLVVEHKPPLPKENNDK